VLGADGALYLVGGSSTGDANGALASVLELDPGAGAWGAAPDMSTERYHHAATLDGQGAIWAMAGNGLSSYLASTEALFAGVWSLRASLPSAHAAIAATTLLDGRILLVDNSTCDLYDPSTGAWTDLPLLRDTTGVTVVHDGRAFAIGGEVNSTPVSEVDSFDPMTTAWTVRAPMSTARRAPGAVYAPDGRIYAIGGTDGTFAIATVEAYFPASDLWSAAVASLAVARSDAGVAVGADGRIYVVGGYDEAAPLASVEVYGPTLSLSASQAARGGAPVSASGANFAASARVGLRLDDVPLAVTTTDAGGAFQVAFVVPANGPAPGSHQLVAEDVRAQYPVTTAFTVTP
jgi:hypothetical protein